MVTKRFSPTSSAYTSSLLIKSLLSSALTVSPQQKIRYRDWVEYTYEEFGKRVCRLAHGLSSMGVKEGDIVAVMDWDSHRYLECYFAVPMIGAVLHTVNVRLSSEQLLYTINHAEDDVILVNSEFLPLLETIKEQIITVKKYVLLDDSSTQSERSYSLDHEYEALLQENPEEYDFPDFDENTIATTFYTTGTTGLPKGVFFSHRQLVLHTHGILAGLCGYSNPTRLDSGDVYMPMTPMFHVHAWGMPYLMTLLGAKQIYPGRYEPEMLLKLVGENKVSFSHCVPTIMHMLLSSPTVNEYDLSGWKVIIGGSALSRGMCISALKRGINVFTGYGMSETCPVLTLATFKPHMLEWRDEDQVTIRCKTGIPIPGVQLEVMGIDGNQLPHDGKTPGEVVVRAPWLTMGYLKEPKKSEELWEGGWLHTGDIGFIDGEGYLQITDRLKDVIKTGGEWVSSLELEDIISRIPGVGEVAVIAVPDSKWGERPIALVVPEESGSVTLTVEQINEAFELQISSGRLPKYGLPERILLVDSLPKTSVGKLNKRQMRKEYSGLE